MIVRMKCLNSAGETNITINNEYVVLGFIGAGTGVIIDDLGTLYQNANDFRSPTQWQLVSVEDIGSVQIFP